jgi:secreted PhoX family phosphatase
VAVSRRALAFGTAGVLLAAALPFALLRRARATPAGLLKDPKKVFDVLPGFEVTVLDRAGDAMSDGYVVPARADGMGVFETPSEPGRIVLLRNHELGDRDASESAHPGRPAPPEAYDANAFGAVTRLVVDPKTLAVEKSNLVLTGTMRNCAGGSSPWGWLTCEEDVSDGHGWVFACDASCSALARPKQIAAYGRMRHEAATVDPETLIAYLTEDREDGCLYRFVPRDRKTPFEGRLQALAVEGSDGFDTSELETGESVRVRWVDVVDPAPSDDSLRARSRERGAARVSRGEGVFLTRSAGKLEVFFTATNGGAASAGQLFRLTPDGDGGELVALAVSTDANVLDMPDNIAVAETGHVFLAEDGVAPNGIKVLCPSGKIVCLGVDPEGASELAGVSLAPSGDVLFANLQERGITIAIRGPLAELA